MNTCFTCQHKKTDFIFNFKLYKNKFLSNSFENALNKRGDITTNITEIKEAL